MVLPRLKTDVYGGDEVHHWVSFACLFLLCVIGQSNQLSFEFSTLIFSFGARICDGILEQFKVDSRLVHRYKVVPLTLIYESSLLDVQLAANWGGA